MSNPVILASGGYADVWDLNDGTVIKAYRSEIRAHGHVVDIKDHDLLTSMFYVRELTAYRCLVNISGIKDRIPKFFGQIDPHVILSSCEGKYVEGAGLRLEKIKGNDKKITHLEKGDREMVVRVLWKMAEHLNHVYVWDASCFYVSDENFKIIDFSLWDKSSDYECHLYDHGSLNETQKGELTNQIEQLTSGSNGAGAQARLSI
jgi:hypothetical protein